MFSRRQFLTRSSLVALSPLVPAFIEQTAWAAAPGKDNVLVLIELTGGNDGLNTVIPYRDDAYHKARPTLHFTKDQVLKLNDDLGLHPAMRGLDTMFQNGQVAIVQGIGYPNPDHSHFESMDIWQSADPKRAKKDGWIGRGATTLQKGGDVAIMHIGARKLPLALAGGGGSVVTINDRHPFRLDLGIGGDEDAKKKRRKLMDELAQSSKSETDNLLSFVQRRQSDTFASVDKLESLLSKTRGQGDREIRQRFPDDPRFMDNNSLVGRLQLVARIIQSGFGTRVFYVSLDGFDTHAEQGNGHRQLLGDLASGISNMFQSLNQGGHDKRVIAMTFSEFGRRVVENGSKGTDHGSGSCLFVAGPAVKGGIVGKHPSLTELDAGDLRWHTDFRRLYATLLDKWLGCDSQRILDGKFERLEVLKGNAQS